MEAHDQLHRNESAQGFGGKIGAINTGHLAVSDRGGIDETRFIMKMETPEP